MQKIFFILAFLASPLFIFAQQNDSSHYDIYHLTISDTTVNYTDKKVKAISVNGQIPAPTLYFKEGDTAIIYVHNAMMMETSVHWHGIILPNNQDGVPYLTTPPIKMYETFMYKFPLKQSGTYWYHSHTMLQEQSGLYGAIVIQPKEEKYKVVGEETLLLSDWTNEKPEEVLRTLKRSDESNEWYAIKKGYAQSFDKLIQHHALKDRLQASFNRIPPMDVSDVYYNTFLINGKNTFNLSKYKAGDKIKLRIINGSSSTYFNIEFAGKQMQMISADGNDISPINVNRVLMGIAETYDFIITVPENGAYEFRATPMDQTGKTSVMIGNGENHFVKNMPKPDMWTMDGMMQLADINVPMKMNSNISMKYMNMKGMSMHHNHDMSSMNEDDEDTSTMVMPDGTRMKMSDMKSDNNDDETDDSNYVIFNYNMLKALQPTALKGKIDRNIVLNLTGNMYRYIWSINNKTLSEQDTILIKRGENVRMILVNNTMMNHPIHLHGHFFRVLNDNGDYSPLKHTVDVPPMRTVEIEFPANEAQGDWMFHCHILYHMMSGMSRIVHYDGFSRDSLLHKYPYKKALDDDKQWFFWGNAELKSQMSEVNLNYINRNNAVRLEGSADYHGKYEGELTYERYIGDWFRPFVGMSVTREKYYNIFNSKQTFYQNTNAPIIGVRYTLPYFIESELRINTKGRVRFQLEGDEWLLPRVMFNWNANTDKEYHLDFQYILAKTLSISAGWDSRYKWGAGLKLRF
ncbi:MAG: multicopper oxidase domain-containing protein [Arachidicoccus sp.]|nr:multicopper oxidase domain-containing protein [Arachidicoccus sp.]